MAPVTFSADRIASTLEPYKGYIGQLEVDARAGILYGEVINLKDVVAFEGRTFEEAKQSFHDSVDAYLEFCKELGQKPEKPFSGKIPFRTDTEHHRMISLAASLVGKSINAWMDDTLVAAAETVIKTCDDPVSFHKGSVSATAPNSVRRVPRSKPKAASEKKTRGMAKARSR